MGGHAAAVKVLLEAAPASVAAADSMGRLPLHCAATAAVAELLLAAAPAAATELDHQGQLPLHWAASVGCTDVAQQLLMVAPHTSELQDLDGYTPLQLALRLHRLAAARCLLGAGPVASAVAALEAAASQDEHLDGLYADLVRARLPLADHEWALLPNPCPSAMSGALPAALAHSAHQAGQLVRHLPVAERAGLRTGALCLARVQRALGLQLPLPLTARILLESASSA